MIVGRESYQLVYYSALTLAYAQVTCGDEDAAISSAPAADPAIVVVDEITSPEQPSSSAAAGSGLGVAQIVVTAPTPCSETAPGEFHPAAVAGDLPEAIVEAESESTATDEAGDTGEAAKEAADAVEAARKTGDVGESARETEDSAVATPELATSPVVLGVEIIHTPATPPEEHDSSEEAEPPPPPAPSDSAAVSAASSVATSVAGSVATSVASEDPDPAAPPPPAPEGPAAEVVESEQEAPPPEELDPIHLVKLDDMQESDA